MSVREIEITAVMGFLMNIGLLVSIFMEIRMLPDILFCSKARN